MTYREAVDAIEAVGTESIKNTTEETRRLLHALGDPDRRIPLIHVAGTNGKGSVCAYLESVLRADAPAACLLPRICAGLTSGSGSEEKRSEMRSSPDCTNGSGT